MAEPGEFPKWPYVLVVVFACLQGLLPSTAMNIRGVMMVQWPTWGHDNHGGGDGWKDLNETYMSLKYLMVQQVESTQLEPT